MPFLITSTVEAMTLYSQKLRNYFQNKHLFHKFEPNNNNDRELYLLNDDL